MSEDVEDVRRRRRGLGGSPDRVTMRLAAAELVESREILPGPVAPGVPRAGDRQRLARGPVRPRPDRGLLRDGPAPAVLGEHRGRRDRHRHDPLPRHRPRHGVVHAAAAGRRGRPARSARPAVRGGSAQPPPAAHRRRPRHGRRPDAGRRGDPRRPPGHAPVRGGELARGLPVEPAARRGRVRRRHRRRLARPPRLRHGSRARATRRWADQAFACGPSGDARRAGAAGRGSARAARRGQARAQARRRSRPIRPARRPRGARRSCRCRWSRTWAAPWAPASVAS